MKSNVMTSNPAGWLFALALVTLGILNLVLVHPVPGIVYMLLSLVYFPPVTTALRNKFSFSIPVFVKIILGIVIVMFTLGVSDLADMID